MTELEYSEIVCKISSSLGCQFSIFQHDRLALAEKVRPPTEGCR